MIDLQKYVSSKYSHQLYYFSEEAQEIRKYFSGLLYNNNNTNDHFIENGFNFDKLANQVSLFTEKSDKYTIVLKMLRNEEALKVITALLFKGFSWTNELMNHFNISKKLYVVNTLWTLQSLNLVVKEKGIKLNRFYFEAIKKSQTYQTTKALHQADVYYINKDFVKFCSLLKELFEHKISTSETFRFSLKDVVSDAQTFEVFYQRILSEETSLYNRRMKTEDGIAYEIETLRAIHNKKTIQNTIAEVRKERLEQKEKQNLLSNEEKGQLATIRENQLVKVENNNSSILQSRKKTTTYNGEEVSFADEILRKQAELDKQIEEAPTIVGDQSLQFEKTSYDDGLYVTNPLDFIDYTYYSKKKKTAEEEADAILGGF